MIVVVTGGRDFADNDMVIRAMEHVGVDQGSTLFHGGATGADALANGYFSRRCYQSMPFPADWKAHGRAAGPIRNQTMVGWAAGYQRDGHDVVVVAFPGGRGTADCVRRAELAGLRVVRAETIQAA